jgi:hypothetical protein
LEAMKLTFIAEKMNKIDEVTKNREEQQINFQKQAEQKLMLKMEANKENRINIMNSLMEKLKKNVQFYIQSRLLVYAVELKCNILFILNKIRTRRSQTLRS